MKDIVHPIVEKLKGLAAKGWSLIQINVNAPLLSISINHQDAGSNASVTFNEKDNT